MTDLLTALRQLVGNPQFYVLNQYGEYYWDYGAMLEYACCIILIGLVIANVFKFLRAMFR